MARLRRTSAFVKVTADRAPAQPQLNEGTAKNNEQLPKKVSLRYL
jgi:hypothetical protein